jgi:hypothetical protein
VGKDATINWVLAPLQVLEVEPQKVTYGATVPSGLGTYRPFLTFPWSPFPHDGLGFVPLAQFRVLLKAESGWVEIGNDMQIGITTPWQAALLVVALSVGAWSVLYAWARQKHIPGGFVRSIIADGNGYTSLSQLQVTVWTFVVAGGAVYVMALSGGLIDVPTQALALLGISGVSVLGGMLSSASSGNRQAISSGEDAQPAPVVIESIAMVGTRGATSLVLTWKPSADGAPATDYVLEHSTNNFATQTTPETISLAPTRELYFTVSELAADKAYQFRVVGRDKQGRHGTPSAVLSVLPMVPLPAGAAPPVLPRVTGLAKIDLSAATAIEFRWTVPQPPAEGYLARSRAITGDGEMRVADAGRTGTCQINNLRPATTYEIQMAAINGGKLGEWSEGVVAVTNKRKPRWSDLVIRDGDDEVDITRVQMLFFTLIAAFYVLLQIVNYYTIPTITDGIVALVGISNTVYLGGKYIKR